jgi:hypothetical protein
MKSIQKAASPSHGGNVPAGKDVTEGQGSNYHQNRNQTKIAGDRAITERTVGDKPQVKRVQANAKNDVSSRTKSEWGN